MSRETWVYVKGIGMVPKAEAPVANLRPYNIIPDFSEPVLCHADGILYNSKRTYERAVARAGCSIVGNESTDHLAQNRPKPAPIGPDLARTWDEMSS